MKQKDTQVLLKEIRIASQQCNNSLNKVLNAMQEELIYKLKSDNNATISTHYINLLIKDTYANGPVMAKLFHRLISLGYISNNEIPWLLPFIEQHNFESNSILILPLLSMLVKQEFISLSELDYALRCLRQSAKLANSNNKIVKVSGTSLLDLIMSYLGKSARGVLVSDSNECIINLQNTLLLFIGIVDGIADPDIDVTMALNCLHTLFIELSALLLLLDPAVAQLIKHGLSLVLKQKITAAVLPLAQLFQCIEVLIMGNPLYFNDFWIGINQQLQNEQHSLQRTLCLNTLVSCAQAGVFNHYMMDEAYKQEFVQFYRNVAKLATTGVIEGSSKLSQISDVVGHFVDLEAIQKGYSDNALILRMLATFNQYVTEHFAEIDNIKLPLLLQKELKRCHKNLLTKDKIDYWHQLLRSYFNIIPLLDYPIQESMVKMLCDKAIQSEDSLYITITNTIVEIIYILQGNVSHNIWQLIQILHHRAIQESNSEQLCSNLKQMILHNFQIEVLKRIIVSYIFLIQHNVYGNHAAKHLLLLITKHANKLQYVYYEMVKSLFNELQKSKQTRYVQTICSLSILKYERTKQVDYDVFIGIAKIWDAPIQDILLSNMSIIATKYAISIDSMLTILSYCEPSYRVLSTLHDVLNNNPIQEHWLDTIVQLLQTHINHKGIDLNKVYEYLIQQVLGDYTDTIISLLSQSTIDVQLYFKAMKQYPQSNEQIIQFSKLVDQHEFLKELCKFTFTLNSLTLVQDQSSLLEKYLESQQPTLIIETTKVIRLYLQAYPKCQGVAYLIEVYDVLYSQSKQELTLTLCQIINDVLDIVASLLRHSNQNIKTLFCVYYKLLVLPLYKDFEECLQEHHIPFDIAKAFTLFLVIRDRINIDADQYYLSQFVYLCKKILSMQQTNELKQQIVTQCLNELKLFRHPEIFQPLKSLMQQSTLEVQLQLISLLVEAQQHKVLSEILIEQYNNCEESTEEPLITGILDYLLTLECYHPFLEQLIDSGWIKSVFIIQQLQIIIFNCQSLEYID